MNPLAAALQILDGAEPHHGRRDLTDLERYADRVAALALAEEQAGMAAGMASSSMSVAEEAVARFLARRSHLILRGGSSALLREALSEPAGTPVARMAEELRREGSAAAGGAAVPAVGAVRLGGTRPHEDGRVRTLESGALRVGDVAFSADGEYVCAFAWGGVPWLDDDWGSVFLQWRVATGELVAELTVGQFREENGSFAISPDLRLLAVRDHRCIAVYELPPRSARRRGRQRLAKLRELRGAEGPYAITFLDEQHLVADDSSLEVVVWNATTGEQLASAPTIGWRDHAVARRASRLLVTGGLQLAGRTVGVHALPSLEMLGTFRDGGAGATQPARGEVIDVSPEERWVATGDESGGILLWEMKDLEDSERQSSPRAPLSVPARLVGQHREEVSALRFIDERRLLSGSWDRSVLCWDLEALRASSPETPIEHRIVPVRRLHGHLGWITSIDVHPERHLAASSSEDGRIILWDLRSTADAPPSPLPAVRKERSMRPHPDGVEVITDGVSTVVVRPPSAGAAPREPPVPQDPELIGINLDGFLVIPVDDPGPPQLLLYLASAPLVALPDGEGHKPSGDPVEVIDLELHSGGLCALGPRSFAVGDGDGHVSFWELSP